MAVLVCFLVFYLSLKKSAFIDNLREVGTNLKLISDGYTCVPQPCDLSSMRSYQGGIRKESMKGVSNTYTISKNRVALSMFDKITLKWASQSFDVSSMEFWWKCFRHITIFSNALSFPQMRYSVTFFHTWTTPILIVCIVTMPSILNNFLSFVLNNCLICLFLINLQWFTF